MREPTHETVCNLRRAADLIERKGLAKMTHRNHEGAYCTIGALNEVRFNNAQSTWTGVEEELLTQWRLPGPLSILMLTFYRHASTYSRVAGWNDAPWRTQHGVVKRLRRVACRLERKLRKETHRNA